MARERKLPFDPGLFLARLGPGQMVGSYKAGDVVFAQGDAADAVFYIQKGKVKITVVSEQGKEAVVAFLGAREFCGEGSLAGQPKRIGTATAVSSAIIHRIQNSTILRLIHEEPAFAESFVAHLLERSVRVEASLDTGIGLDETGISHVVNGPKQGSSASVAR